MEEHVNIQLTFNVMGFFEKRALWFQINGMVKTKLVWEGKTLEETEDIEISYLEINNIIINLNKRNDNKHQKVL